MNPVIEKIYETLSWIGPAVMLILAGCLIQCGSLLTKNRQPRDADAQTNGYALVTLTLLIVAFAWHWLRGPIDATPNLSGLFIWDSNALAAEKLAYLGGIIIALICWAVAPRAYLAEYFGCLAIIVGAVALVGACNDLIAMFLTLELISIPTYVLLGTTRGTEAAQESTVKYFLLSAFASAFFLFGCSYLYGIAGTTDLTVIAASINASESNMLALLGLVFIVCGLAFRITAVPFHFYGPDLFEGTSISMAAMMSYVPKVAGFVALVRFLGPIAADSTIGQKLVPLILILSVLTFCIGNVMAASQQNLRRLLGYSSVAHSGYILLGLAAFMVGGSEARVIFTYLLIYAAMTLGVFAFLAEVEVAGGSSQLIGDLSGMFYRRPAASVAAVICLVSLIGLPLTAGMWAKIQVFFAAVGVDNRLFLVCAILMAINAAIAAGYYWRILAKLFDRSAKLPPLRAWRPSLFLAYSICAVLTLVWFFVPSGM